MKFNIQKLENGLTIVFLPDKSNKVVSSKLFVKAGSIFEKDLYGSGISHYFEHIMAGGTTRKRTEIDYNFLRQKIGADFNAYTTYDHTAYFITVNSKYKNDSMEMLSEWLIDCAFQDKEIEREKGVILKEILMSSYRPLSRMWQHYYELFYRFSPRRFPIIGYEELFKKLSKDHILQYYMRRYIPQNATLVVGGDIDKKFVENTYKLWSRWEKSEYLVDIYPFEQKRNFHTEDTKIVNLSTPRLLMGWPVPELLHNDIPALEITSYILGKGRNARFVENIKEKNNLVYDIYTYLDVVYYDKGIFLVIIELKNENDKDKVAEKVYNEIYSTKNSLTEEELMRAKQIIKTEILRSATSIQDKVLKAGISYLSTGHVDFDEKYLRMIESVSIDDVKNVIEKYLLYSHEVRGFYPSKTEKTTFDFEGGKPYKVEENIINNIKLIQIVKDTPLFKLAIIFDRGVINETATNNGITNFLLSMLFKGSKNYSERDIAQVIEDTGGYFDIDVNRDFSYIYLEGLNEHLSSYLAVLKDILLNPLLPDTEVDKIRERILAEIKMRQESPSKLALYEFNKYFWKNNAYGFSVLGEKEVIKNLTKARLSNFYIDFYKSFSTIVFQANKKYSKEIKSFVKQLSFNRTSRKYYNHFNIEIKRTSKKIYRYAFPQVNLVIGYPTVSISHKDYPGLSLLAEYLSSMEGPLFQLLRGSDDLVYLVTTKQLSLKQAGVFLIFTQTSTNFWKAVKNKLLSFMSNLREKGILNEDFEKVKNSIILKRPIKETDERSNFLRIVEYEGMGLGYKYIDRFYSSVRKLTLSEFNAIIKKYMKHYRMLITFPKGKEK